MTPLFTKYKTTGEGLLKRLPIVVFECSVPLTGFHRVSRVQGQQFSGLHRPPAENDPYMSFFFFFFSRVASESKDSSRVYADLPPKIARTYIHAYIRAFFFFAGGGNCRCRKRHRGCCTSSACPGCWLLPTWPSGAPPPPRDWSSQVCLSVRGEQILRMLTVPWPSWR